MNTTPTPQRSTWTRMLCWLGKILATLKAIETSLASIEQTQIKLNRCISDDNHRGKMSLRTGHWNDMSNR